MNLAKKSLLLISLIVLVGTAAAISLKAAIGIGAWDAMTQTLASVVRIKIGTLGMILNISCVIGQLLINKKNFRLIQWLQIPLSVLLGSVVNFILYNILGSIVIDNYILRVIILILAYCLSAFGVGAVMVLNLVTFPLEGLCQALCEKIGVEFSKFRQGLDIFFIALALIFTWLFKVELSIREGTVIGMLIFGPLMGLFMRKVEPIFRKHNLLEEVKSFEEDNIYSEAT